MNSNRPTTAHRTLLTSAFTLIEVLMVVGIISLLIIIAVWAFRTQLSKGYDSRRKTDIYQIKIAAEEYEKDHNCYPAFISCQGEYADDLKPYIPIIPCDPRTKQSYVYTPDSSSICPKYFWIFTTLENKADPKIDDLGCTNGCGPNPQVAVYNYYQASPNAPSPSTAGSGPQQTFAPGSETLYWGCFGLVCERISLDPEGYPVCQPNFGRDDCYNLCENPDTGVPQNQCL
jgi:type II secretory pathway pseudopilin PulG